jgi:hypothetical protein
MLWTVIFALLIPFLPKHIQSSFRKVKVKQLKQKKMKTIISFLLPIALLVIGVQFTRDYFGDTSKERKTKLEELISGGTETDGVLQNEYTEKTIKIAKIPVKTYEVTYSFKVNETEYTGTKTLKSPPTESAIKITYLPTNPAINASNPQEELALLNNYENDSTTLIIGLVLMLAGLGLGYFRFKSYQKSKAA